MTIKSLFKRVLSKIKRELASLFKKQVFPKGKNINVQQDFEIGKYHLINVPSPADATIKIGKNVRFREFCNMLVYDNAKLFIHDAVFFNNYCSINCLHQIEIGEGCMFGEGVKLYDHNHQIEYLQDSIHVKGSEYTKGAIAIGRGCWIGANVTILKGVTIGDNVVIGAGNLIYKSIASNTIVKAKVGYVVDSLFQNQVLDGQ